MELEDSHQRLLDKASKDLAKYCYVLWDYFNFPELTTIKTINDSILVVYENHIFFSGRPNKEIITSNNFVGDLSLSFEKSWLGLIKMYFFNFSPVTSPAIAWYNHFFCMELKKENFNNVINEFESIRLQEEHLSYLSIKRQIHYSLGPATAVIKNNQLIACAFAPHILNMAGFSYGVIRDVWTAPEWRGRGLGTDVTEHLCKILFDMGLNRIFLWVEKNNKAAIRVYNKLGFEVKSEILSAFASFRGKDASTVVFV